MTIDRQMLEKMAAARIEVASCISAKGMGICASADGRYEGQCWGRDLHWAGAPALRAMARHDVVDAHLREVVRRQRPDGKVPILFLDDPERFVRRKEERVRRTGKPSILLDAYRRGELEHFSPWTKDGEYLFALAVYEQMRHRRRLSREEARAVDHALAYTQACNLVDGLVVGADWRDTNTWLADTALLSNNCLYFQALTLADRGHFASKLQDRINEAFWTGNGYRDHLGVETTDAFGLALGVLYGVFPPERRRAVLEQLVALRTPHGYLANDCRPNPTTEEERRLLDAMPQSKVIWPFIHGYVTRALARLGCPVLAMEALARYTALDGFWEFYFPDAGRGGGAKEQMWSAAQYLVCVDELLYRGKI